MLFIIILLAMFIIFLLIKHKVKSLKLGNLVVVTGGVKTGKSTLGVYQCKKVYKRKLRKHKFHNALQILLPRSKRHYDELPLFYSNVPVKIKGCDIVELTEDILLRKKRMRYDSVVYVNEASLVADSQNIKNMDNNNRLLLFNKLIAHELKGGFLLYDTQKMEDCHYSIKRSCSSFLWIHHITKIPFFIVFYLLELTNADNSSNSNEDDVESKLKIKIVPKSIWKCFDCYCWSVLTDNLPVEENTYKVDNLKCNKIVSFRDWNKYVGGNKNEKKDNN